MLRVALLTVLAVATVVACGGDDSTVTQSATGVQGEITVFAAASLTEAFGEVKEAFEAEHPGATITYNFGGSQGLVTQLTQGARADVLAPANMAQMTVAMDGEVIDGEVAIFTRNRMAIIVPVDNPGAIAAPVDLGNSGLKVVVAAPDVPVGRYTGDVLDLMAADAAFGTDFRQRVEANYVSLEDNVRQVVSKVALGEADAGVVYVTDVTEDVRGDVTIIEIPERLNVVAEYPIAAVREGDSMLAEAFIAFVLSVEGQAILEGHGFTGLE